MTWKLTPDQQEASNKFLGFLLSNETEFYLFGAAGCGKTFLIQHFVSEVLKKDYKNLCALLGIPQKNYMVALTATTNKAVQILQKDFPAEYVNTIFKEFDVVVQEDYKTGKVNLKKYFSHEPVQGKLVFIDECSMLSKQMLEIIRKYSDNCKIVFIGDNYQLAPVNEKAYWNSTPEHLTATLSTPVRNNKNEFLMSLCAQLRETVDTKEFKPIRLVPGSVEHLNTEEASDYLKNKFNKDTARILCYTNEKSQQYIDFLKKEYGIPHEFEEGKKYINTRNCTNHTGYIHFYAEEPVQITQLDSSPIYAEIEKGYCLHILHGSAKSLSCNKEMLIEIPADLQEYKELKAKAKKEKNWKVFFYLQNRMIDLRLPYATTVHKSQGSTYDEVLIDLDSFKSCWDKDVAARLLYVAVSRAKNKVMFYGTLPKRYGELV